MSAVYHIDISKNEVYSYRSLGRIAYTFVIFFAAIGILLTIGNLRKGSSVAGYLQALCPLLVALSVYLQASGRFPYRKFFHVDLEKVQFRTVAFNTVTLGWTQIKEVDVGYTKVVFLLYTGRKTTFNLDKITMQQIRELKVALRKVCSEKEVSYQSVS